MQQWISNIQRFSLHDGPGVRTTVFFQGCNLRCAWCHNPETWPMKPAFEYQASRCLGCQSCTAACPQGALTWAQRPVLEEGLCIRCGQCADQCPSGAWRLAGQRMSVEQLLDKVRVDEPFYAVSHGGVTCSGGEPLLAGEFLEQFLRAAHSCGLHTAVDTAAHQPWERYRRILPWTDLFLVDYKLADEAEHLKQTGVSNELIRENLRRFVECGQPVWVRVPIIPGVNDRAQALQPMAQYLREIGFTGPVELLSFHKLGQTKYDQLGRAYPFAQAPVPQEAQMEIFRALFREEGLEVR